ncbi:MAG: helix-turn-helix domain-containing protein [Deltaproteobacteria bacterium]|jgi:transcriptional regulator with XRE-family HTH domain|nr:helix-turn-helix domain-containing protein [Deltaproteobacteria bacterium]
MKREKILKKETVPTETEALIKNLKLYMKKRGFDLLADLAQKSGVSYEILRKIMTGHVKYPKHEHVIKLANALQIPAGELLDSEEKIITNINIAPNAIIPKWVKLTGDEMYPTFKPDDSVLVDFGINKIDKSGIYVIPTIGDNYGFRRVEVDLIAEKALIKCDNEKYTIKTEMKIKDVKILGRVIGSFVNYF